MGQRTLDVTVLVLFALLYKSAVFLLRFRRER
jgi:hypothetical protein